MKKIFCIVLTVMVAIPALAFASAQATTSEIAGRVSAKDGTPMVGATVVATHMPSSTQYGTMTDSEGYFRLSGMRVGGPYQVEFSFVGANTARFDNITLELGKVKNIDVTLDDSQSIETIVVNGEPFESSKTGAASNFNSSTIGIIPTVSRSIYDVAKLSPQVMVSKDGGVSIAGANTRYNSFQMDGIVSNDVYGLTSSGTNGGLADANPIPLDAIDEIQVVVAPFDVRQSGFTGGGINAITKSGTNTFSGSAYTYYNNQDFYGKSSDAGIKLAKQSTQIYGVSLGGPIVRDKLFFFVNGEFNYDTSPSSFYPGYPGSRITVEDAETISNRYEELTGYDGGGYSRRNVVKRNGSVIARLDWNINDRHNLTLRYNYLDAMKQEYSNSATSFMFNSAGYASVSRMHSLVGELNSRISQTTFNVLRIGYSRIIDGRDNEVSLPYVRINAISPDNNTSVYIGTNPYSGVNELTQNVVSISDNVSFYIKDHTFTFGTDNEIYMADNLYMSNAFGSYVYNTMDDFLNNNPSQYSYNYAIGDPTIHMYTAQFGFYVQDEWLPVRNLTLTYGLRADIPVIFNDPEVNPDFNASETAQKYGVRVGDKPKTQILLSPRIGFRWQIDSGKRFSTLLRGGVGLFTGRVPFVWITNCYSNTGMTQRGYSITDPADIPAFGNRPDSSVEAVSNPSINVIDPDFRYPQALRANIAIEQKVDDWKFTVEAIFSKVYNDLFVQNLVASDTGNKLYAVSEEMSNDRNTSIYYDSSVKSRYSSIYYLSNTSKGYSYSLSASVYKHFAFGLNMSAAYTFGHSYTVNDGISAQAASIWGRYYNPDSNTPKLSYSLFDTPHKITVALSYAKRYAKYFGTDVSLIYQAHSGLRYTYTNYRNNIDINNDSYYGNMPMYIPTTEELSAMQFTSEADRQKFGAFIEGDKYLRTHRGQYAERNAMQLPFEHQLDLHLAQDFYFGAKTSRKIQISLDIINLGNLLCKDWGANYYLSDWKLSPIAVTSLIDDGRGNKTPVYSYVDSKISKDDLLSRWHMQIGLRVVF